MILDSLDVNASDLEARTGWAIKPAGACKGEVCVPLPPEARRAGQLLDARVLDARVLGERLGMPLVADEPSGLWSLGPETGVTGRALTTAVAPDLVLPDVDGREFRLSSLRGQKVVLVAWASWCGCRFDLPVWQALRTELHGRGLEIVTVALDTEGAEAARPWIEKARPEHPSLIDTAHVVDELFGVVNVPNGVWVDEAGMIVRPAEPAWPGKIRIPGSGRPKAERPERPEPPKYIQEMMADARRIRTEPDLYPAMIRDWAENGEKSEYVLAPDEVVSRSQPRSADFATAAAHFELGQHLHRAGNHAGAVPHWREAHRLYPDNWTYKREAWNFEDPGRQGPTDVYEGSWLGDLRKIGPENYYPPIQK